MSEVDQPLLEYFEIKDDSSAQRTWFLGKPKLEDSDGLDIWAFTSGRQLSFGAALVVPVQKKGDITDITFSHYDVPYVQPRIGQLLHAFAAWDIQRVPARLETGEEIEILNVLTVLDCFDHERSEATYKGDKLNMVMKLRIREEAAEGHHILE